MTDRDRDGSGRPRNARPRDGTGRPLARGSADAMAQREEPDEVVIDARDALVRAAALTAAERYFEAHEFLEWIWKSDDTPPEDRDFWKGVTQVVVGCVHVQRGNREGALRLLQRGSGHLAERPEEHRGVDVAALRRSAGVLAEDLRRDAAPDEVALPVLTLLR